MDMDGRSLCIRTVAVILLSLLFQITAFAQTVDDQSATEYPPEWESALSRIPADDMDPVVTALEQSGSNVSSLLNTLVSIPDGWLPGAIFLIKNMPIEDLTVVTEEMMTDNLRYSYEARATYPWTAELSEEEFFHYVLPMRVSQEPLENWRPYFTENICPLLSDVTTREEASEAALGWARSLAGFRQTQRRDQGPFETIASGFGRCEELMILYIDACRAAGVPARQAWTPYWTYQDNNHAWTELMNNDGEWYYLDGWINIPTKRTSFVFSVPFGLPDPDANDLYRFRDNPGASYAIINSISDYRPSTQLVVRVTDMNGDPVPEASVYYSIWNFGALRPVASGETDENGEWTITAGPGGCFVSAGDGMSGTCTTFQLPEQDEYILELTIGLGAELPPNGFWLRFPYPSEVSQ